MTSFTNYPGFHYPGDTFSGIENTQRNLKSTQTIEIVKLYLRNCIIELKSSSDRIVADIRNFFSHIIFLLNVTSFHRKMFGFCLKRKSYSSTTYKIRNGKEMYQNVLKFNFRILSKIADEYHRFYYYLTASRIMLSICCKLMNQSTNIKYQKASEIVKSWLQYKTLSK